MVGDGMLEDVGSFREVPAHVVDCGVYYLRHRIMEEEEEREETAFDAKPLSVSASHDVFPELRMSRTALPGYGRVMSCT